jgi:hypothetical protein
MSQSTCECCDPPQNGGNSRRAVVKVPERWHLQKLVAIALAREGVHQLLCGVRECGRPQQGCSRPRGRCEATRHKHAMQHKHDWCRENAAGTMTSTAGALVSNRLCSTEWFTATCDALHEHSRRLGTSTAVAGGSASCALPAETARAAQHASHHSTAKAHLAGTRSGRHAQAQASTDAVTPQLARTVTCWEMVS